MKKAPLLSSRSQQRGQAMIETAIVIPLLLVLFLAVGYFGHAILSLQTLNAASRAAAREMALDSTSSSSRRVQGNYEASREVFLEAAQRYMNAARPEQLTAREQTRLSHNYNSALNLEGSFNALGQHRFVYALTETVNATSGAYNSPPPQDRNNQPPANLDQLQFGIGATFYGGTLQYRLEELTPLSRFLFRAQKDPVIQLGATSLMPAELPLRGEGYGLMNLNPWMANLIGGKVDDNPDYPDLIED